MFTNTLLNKKEIFIEHEKNPVHLAYASTIYLIYDLKQVKKALMNIATYHLHVSSSARFNGTHTSIDGHFCSTGLTPKVPSPESQQSLSLCGANKRGHL